MRPFLLALVAGAACAAPARAADTRHFDDAALHAVQFVDAKEGWAVGDEGVIWHTIDGGETWERQPTGVRASLRALHFLDGFQPHLHEACIGTISEVFDAEEPYKPGGCVAQAWGVAELLRCLLITER